MGLDYRSASKTRETRYPPCSFLATRTFNSLRARICTLTAREHEVFGLVVLGCLNKQIAHQLGTAERTVKAHRHSVMQKLGARSVAELVSIAVKIATWSRDALGRKYAPKGNNYLKIVLGKI
jgi:DNA-binding NarL/FixJ family response regulator